MRRTPGSLLIIAVLAVLGIAMSGTARAEYPVTFNFFAGIPYELTNPGGSLPGANDWACKVTAAHPDPVVLIHGTAGGAQTNWGAYAPLLANQGYCVYALTYGSLDVPWPLSAMGGMKPIPESAAQLAAFVDRVLTATGAAKVDFVAHSQGNTVGDYYIKRLGGHGKVDKFVAIAPPWLGIFGDQMNVMREFGHRLGVDADTVDSIPTMSAICQACPEMLGNSSFINALNADGVYDPTVTYTNLASNFDEGVFPSVALVPGPNVTNVLMQDGCATDFSDHLAIAGSHRAAMVALNALDPEHRNPVPCEFVPPFTG
ncbi:alpha/beta fold hydrolase [Nocardia sp. ET3-3]|uniref:Alpha/beta fold hydrolase n=1 Tax=Nocardia terrae TaxID=2675851 RepID=A0A7K1UYT8_9NOCA|nr:alpha/beta fold hydrolase [Nocardia terrae]MVU79417.1 alpha/beta fold hydrolase [Nocardia terrae]